MKVLLGKLELTNKLHEPSNFGENFWFFDKLCWGLLSSWIHTATYTAEEDTWTGGEWIVVRPQGSKYNTIALWADSSRPKWKQIESLIEANATFDVHPSLPDSDLEKLPNNWELARKLPSAEI